MSIFSKLAFWKKGDAGDDFGKDMPGFGDNLGLPKADNFGFPPNPNAPNIPKAFEEEVDPTGGSYAKQFGAGGFGESSRPKDDFFQPAKPFTIAPQQQLDSGYHAAKDFEIISSKLDALRAAIDSINQRLINVEDLVRREKKDKDRYW